MANQKCLLITAAWVFFPLLSTATLALCQGPSATCGPVMTDKRAVAGSPAGSGWAFKGIPYAQPPTGALRFRAPVPHDPWAGVLSTTAYEQPVRAA
jgi:para-nitrobenzyl esterase